MVKNGDVAFFTYHKSTNPHFSPEIKSNFRAGKSPNLHCQGLNGVSSQIIRCSYLQVIVDFANSKMIQAYQFSGIALRFFTEDIS